MWKLNMPEHQGALSALVTGEPKDLVLVSEDGSRVATYGLLLALHSPFVAKLLSDAGLKTAISLTFPLSSISALANVLQRRGFKRGGCLPWYIYKSNLQLQLCGYFADI